MSSRQRAQVPADQLARDRIIGELDRNLLVEAGAGSGKTRELTHRMAAGVASGKYRLEEMAAVTFTRKAAAELRGRFQLALEDELTRAGDAERAARLRDALSTLERFFAGTIHAFCARLLRERPVEAGVSPGFTELDDVEDRMLREQSWRDYRVQAKASGDHDLLELNEAGITPRHLDKAFETVCLYEDVEFPGGDSPMPDPAPAWAALEAFWGALSALLPAPRPDDSTCKTQERAEQFAREWRAFRRGRREPALLARLLKLWESTPKVVQKWWRTKSDALAAQALHTRFREEVVQPYLTAWRQYVYGRCTRLLVKARQAAREERLRRNTLSFNDLLLLTAEVLRTTPDVRRALQQKYRWLFVDEFQDTDPVQAEIMFLLAAEEPDATPAHAAATGGGSTSRRTKKFSTRRSEQPDLFGHDPIPGAEAPSGPADWRTMPLRRGALFVVGDPKQSIYRFRRADIDVYNDVRSRLAGPDGRGVVALTTNFRSVPGLCAWANDIFSRTFPAEPSAVAPRFEPLVPFRAEGAGPCLAVIDLPEAIEPSRLAAEEAGRIARYIRGEVAAGRRTYGDFLILTRRKRALRPYADALEALGVPIEVTGAGAFGDSDEVRELALLLVALSDPEDTVALTGVLRGALFGLSDADLFASRAAGGRIHLFSSIDAGADADHGIDAEAAARVGRALESLRQWHTWTRQLPAGSALERVLDDSGYLALAATARGGVEAGDLLHAVDRVRAAVADGFTLADAADALSGWCGLDADEPDDSTEVDSLPLEPGRADVVRLMNLHKAKGLEARVVFLADPFGGYKSPADIRIVRDGATARGYFRIEEERDGYRGARPIAEPSSWSTYEGEEQAYLEAELNRLFYVAATRAQDMVVIGRYTGKSGGRTAAWPVLVTALTGAEPLPVPDTAAAEPHQVVEASTVASAAAARQIARRHERASEPSWAATSVTAEAKRLPRIAAEQTDALDAHDPTKVVVPATASHRADAGFAWGTLVHGLLEHAMRHRAATRDDLRRLGWWLTVEDPSLRPLVDDAVETALAVVRAPELASARATAECHEEVPFAVRDETGLVPRVLTGTIDLVHRTAPDEWRVVDYKTDVGLDAESAAAKYAAQVGAYTDAWRRLAAAGVRTAIIPARKSGDRES